MSWRALFVLVVLLLAASAAAGVGVGNWLVEQSPSISADPRTDTSRPIEIVLDAAGRPLAAVAPQPLLDGSLGQPRDEIQPMWEIQAVSLFETNLDPMVVLARGDESYTVSDMLTQAGAGLAQGEGDVATVDLTLQAQTPPEVATVVAAEPVVALAWDEQLAQAIDACQRVGFFSRPGCIEAASKKFCDPNRAWGRHPLCPSTTSVSN
jgi:hypothetical protein